MKNYLAIFVLSLILPLAHVATAQQVIYVKATAIGNGDGSSWQSPFASLQDALAVAASGDEIWVSAGTYYPDEGSGFTSGNRSLAFGLKSGIRIHGGFAGSESSKGGRDLALNRTILSGDLSGDDDGLSRYDDNSYHVVRADGADDATLLEGVTVYGGNANGADADSLGGGILISGGAPWLINVRVNSSIAGCGGGIAVVDGGTPTLVNMAVNGNRAAMGGGICNVDSAPAFVNATITGNTASTGPGVYNLGSDVSIQNSIVFGNRRFADADHCAVWQYPCILADVSEASHARTAELMDGAYALRNTGSMVDVLEYFRSQPDVVQVFGDSTTVAMRVAGGRLSYFLDGSKIFPAGFGKRDGSPTQEAEAATAEILANPVIAGHTLSVLDDDSQAAGMLPKERSVGVKSSIARPHSIVGEDLNGDGVINNRDGKRALILSPLGLDDGYAAAELMARASGYGLGVEFAGPPVLTGDFTLANWANWDDFDFIYLSTVARTVAEFETGVLLAYFVTGIPFTEFASLPQSANGVRTAWLWRLNPEDQDTAPLVVVSKGYFQNVYNGRLDNAVLICAWCSLEGDWTRTLGDQESYFGVMGWENNADVATSTQENEDRLFNETSLADLVDGFSLAKAYSQVDPNWDFSAGLYSYGLAKMRITELPVLIFVPIPTLGTIQEPTVGGTPIVDGTDITELIRGTVGDGQPDDLVLPVHIGGVLREDSWLFKMSVFVDGTEVLEPTSLDTDFVSPDAQGTGFVIFPTVELGYDVQNGPLSIDVVIEAPNLAPDWGQSSYSVVTIVGGYSCSASSKFNGYRNGSFTGAASWKRTEVQNDAFVTLTIESAASIMSGSFGPADFNLTMILENPVEHRTIPQVKVDSTTFDVSAALTSRYVAEPWFNTYTGTSGCPGCEARVRVDSTSADGITWFGEYSFLGKDVTSSSAERRLTYVEGKFSAVQGDATGSSPYFECLKEFWKLAE